MRPKPRFIMSPSTARVACTTPMTLSSNMSRNCGEEPFMNGMLTALPAFAIRMSIGARSGRPAVTAAATAASSVTSAPHSRRHSRPRPLLQRALLAAEHRDRGAGAGERRRDGPPDAAPAAGHKSMPPVKHGHEAPLRGPRIRSAQITLSFKFLGFKKPGRLRENYFKLKVIASPRMWRR